MENSFSAARQHTQL